FVGFLPARAGERRRTLEDLRDRNETLVWFEAPHRIVESLEDAASVLGARRACIARELTKIHEEAARGTLPELARLFGGRGGGPLPEPPRRLGGGGEGRGEVTAAVEGAGKRPAGMAESDIDREIANALAAGEEKRALSRRLARLSGRPAREIYRRAVSLAGREAEGGKWQADETGAGRQVPSGG